MLRRFSDSTWRLYFDVEALFGRYAEHVFNPELGGGGIFNRAPALLRRSAWTSETTEVVVVVAGYSWIPYNSSIRQSGLTPSILHYNWFCDLIC
jgi:hypothetical protein